MTIKMRARYPCLPMQSQYENCRFLPDFCGGSRVGCDQDRPPGVEGLLSGHPTEHRPIRLFPIRENQKQIAHNPPSRRRFYHSLRPAEPKSYPHPQHLACSRGHLTIDFYDIFD
jgi:hypothetical protein